MLCHHVRKKFNATTFVFELIFKSFFKSFNYKNNSIIFNISKNILAIYFYTIFFAH
jgi:hypothetical protein